MAHFPESYTKAQLELLHYVESVVVVSKMMTK